MMAASEYLSLEEALKRKHLDRFIEEHQAKGDEIAFNARLALRPNSQMLSPDVKPWSKTTTSICLRKI